MNYIKWLDNIGIHDIPTVGGKNASLGEMYRNLNKYNIQIPNAFVLTVKAYNTFIEFNNLDKEINQIMDSLDTNNIPDLIHKGSTIRNKITKGKMPLDIENDIFYNYNKLSNIYSLTNQEADVAVRSSSTAEDLPDASFAGLQETFLNVKGKYEVIESIKRCFASLYTDRAISYRKTMNYDKNITISVCIQKMVRSDLGSAGVAFSIDTESGFKDTILINGSYGLGEMVVGGKIKPDEFLIFKKKIDSYIPIIDKKIGNKCQKMIYSDDPIIKTEIIETTDNEKNTFCLNNNQILQLSKWVTKIEEYYTKNS